MQRQGLDDGWLQIPPDEVNPNDNAEWLNTGAGKLKAMTACNRNWVFASNDGAATIRCIFVFLGYPLQ
ncbi:MAG: hypothetical protein SAK29_12925 [Scytonema sp. PMC 1069.18]|nr:hypothetical protein [Scytonema sp. PMC 1069.18]MEC4885170.1 hypothetical protein [Scytonema sp. PMC 1070.18]MEC4886502.1 hypothetical protein [Scytonema sp. PMC 1070.18]